VTHNHVLQIVTFCRGSLCVTGNGEKILPTIHRPLEVLGASFATALDPVTLDSCLSEPHFRPAAGPFQKLQCPSSNKTF
jgi:hypothetical protein